MPVCLFNEHIPFRVQKIASTQRAFLENSQGVVFPFPLRFLPIPQCNALSPNKVFCPGTEKTAHLGGWGGGKQDGGRMPTGVHLCQGPALVRGQHGHLSSSFIGTDMSV